MRISVETARSLAWQQRALCQGSSPDDFFPETKPKPGVKDLCKECPVREACLAYAISVEAVGIWGGMSTKERRVYASLQRAVPTTREPAAVEAWLAS